VTEDNLTETFLEIDSIVDEHTLQEEQHRAQSLRCRASGGVFIMWLIPNSSVLGLKSVIRSLEAQKKKVQSGCTFASLTQYRAP
jgi:hypothetical protein